MHEKDDLEKFQHTAARRRLVLSFQDNNNKSFNTQPPEGGWIFQRVLFFRTAVSTHSRPKAAGAFIDQISFSFHVSTHSRPKAAGSTAQPQGCNKDCFNTQPPEGGWGRCMGWLRCRLCFNTQPPEGGWKSTWRRWSGSSCFNTQPPEGGWVQRNRLGKVVGMFQHTAARRRLGKGRQ